MQIWILPVFPLPGTVERRAMKMDFFICIERDANVMSGEQMLALRAKPHLAERPPAFQRIGRLKEPELAPRGFWEGGHVKNYRYAPVRCRVRSRERVYCAVQPPSTVSMAP